MAALLQISGLQTFHNEFSIRPGALLEAINIVIDKNHVAEPRRGFKKYGNTFGIGSDVAKQLFTYKDRLLRQFASTLQFDNGSGTFTSFNGTFTEPETGTRMKSIEANGNFYFTTDAGIKKISATSASEFSSASGYITDAGGVKALDATATIDYSISGFLTPLSKTAYRIVWGIKDANNNLILGSPSSRTVITNFSTTQSAVVNLSFTVPAEVTTTDYFYQIYRTAVFDAASLSDLNDVDPGDEMNLIIEANVSTAQISAGTVSEQDITPEDFRQGGTLLYTNPVSGQGIEQANEKPPMAKDVARFKESIFYANTETRHRKTINLLGLSGFTTGTSKFVISNGTTTNTYTYVGVQEVSSLTNDTKANTTDGGYILLSAASNERRYFVWYDKSGTTNEPSAADTVGKIPIRVDISGDVTAAQVAAHTKLAIETIAPQDFSITISTATLTITNKEAGTATDIVFGLTTPGGATAVSTSTQGLGEDTTAKKFLLSKLSTPSQQVDATARSMVKVINNTSTDLTYAYYLSGPDDVPGEMLFEKRTLVDNKFYFAVNQTGISDKFNPELPVTNTITAITNPSTTVIEVTTSAVHGLVTGDTVIVYGSNSTPVVDGVYTITSTPTTSKYRFTFTSALSVAGTTGNSFLGSVASDNEVSRNRLYYSKYQQPEAVPLLNYVDIGPKDKEIKRILALRDSLFVLKEDGVYRVTGSQAPNFSVTLFDNSANIKAADSAVTLNNLIYMFSTQGITTVSETGVGIISRDIENLLINLPTYDNFTSATFGVPYETDRSYLLWTVTSSDDEFATQCFRYNTFTQCWVRWDNEKTCGIVNSFDDKLYLGAADENFIEQERKSGDRTDYADREFSLSIPAQAVDNTLKTVKLSSSANVVIGDVILQTQYVSIYQFNSVLLKLDIDHGVTDTDYFSTLGMSAGDSLTTSMTNLVAKLNADATTTSTYSFSGTTDLATIQTEFNTMINTLNTDTGVFLSNYKLSSGTTIIETPVTANDKTKNQVTVLYALPWTVGAITHLVGVKSTVIWAPISFGDPSMLKQVSEGTMIFHDNLFTTAEIAYATDLNPSFELINFSGTGLGNWGQFVWTQQNWGGEGNATPLRTLVPLNKQRCRFIKPRFKHNNAREGFAILGVSFESRNFSSRGYK